MKRVFDKKFVFITGAPRSGTSMLTKVIDGHPDIAMLMENNFKNFRRHWHRAEFWNSQEELREQVRIAFSRLDESYIGTKNCTPDVWSADDIVRVCKFFPQFKILFLVRDPRGVAMSRYLRQVGDHDYTMVFNQQGRENMLLNFDSKFHTYISSWRQSVENYWRLKDGLGDNVKLIYYEDFCKHFEKQVRDVFNFLKIGFSPRVWEWHRHPHYDKMGNLGKDLKYKDAPVFVNDKVEEIPRELKQVLKTIKWQFKLWKKRKL